MRLEVFLPENLWVAWCEYHDKSGSKVPPDRALNEQVKVWLSLLLLADWKEEQGKRKGR